MNIPFLNREISSVHAAALVLGGAALLSRLLGLLRDRLLAARFGAGDVLDVYYAAFQIPDFLFTVFLIGAASAAVLPVFLAYDRTSEKESRAFIGNLLTIVSVAAGVMVLGAIVLAPKLVVLVAPGFDAAKLAMTVGLTRIMLPAALFLSIAGILSSVLQARHRFFVFALPPLFYNLGIIGGILFLVPWVGVQGLAYGVVAGGVLQILVQLPAIAAMGFRIRPAFNPREPGFVKVVRTAFPRVLAISMSQLTIVALAAIASFFAAGSISTFRLASNLLYVPVGLFGVSYALAVFPKLSGATLDGRGEYFREQVAIGIRQILLWALPASVLFLVLRAHIVRVVLGSGVFDWADTRLVAAILGVLAVAIISESLVPLVLRSFYALGRSRDPLLWDIVGSLLTVFGAVGFTVWFAAEPGVLEGLARIFRIGDLPNPKILGVAAAFSLGSLANIALLSFALRRATRKRLGVELAFPGDSIASLLGAAVLGGAAAYGALIPFPAIIATNTFAGIFSQGLLAGIVGLAVYASALAWQKNPEIMGLIKSFRERLISIRKTPQVYEAEKLDGEGTREGRG